LSSDKEFVQYSGVWEPASVTGQAGLFESNNLQAAPEKVARCEIQLPVKESGNYKICLIFSE